MREIWKDILGHQGYQISSRGRVRSLSRTVTTSNSVRFYKGRIIKQSVQHLTGYKVFCVSHKGEKKVLRTHRIWMKSFKGESHLQVNHKNGDRTDISARNLEYVTALKNHNHRATVLKNQKKYGCYWNKKSKKWIAAIRLKDRVHYLGSFHDKEQAHKKFYNSYLHFHGVKPW